LRRVTLFLKGNSDLRDSLHSCRVDGAVAWNGLNQLMRGRHPDLTVRLKHETFTRSDALLASTGAPPPALAERELPLGAFSQAMQFSRALFESPADAIILSLQPDVASNMVRHRREGWLLHPAKQEDWAPADRAWLRAEFEPLPMLDVAASMANLERIVAACQAGSEAPVLVYNLSAALPGELVHCHLGLEESQATRIRRFNLGLVELSQRTGVSIIDVDAIVARHGADRLLLDSFHLRPEACRLVAEEVARVLEEVLCL
jgi:hypothetical protein